MAGFDISSIFNSMPSSGTQELATLDIGLIRPDPKNKAIYKIEGIEDLAANIELVGLQQPLNVRPDPEAEGQYIAVSGHRRLEALKLLVSEGKERFANVPCMVVENGSEALNELRLIYGNANTRQLSNWELSRQAERVQELFYQLKEEGIEFPGRMRDHVAAACQVSKSKLARLKVINERLEVFIEQWQDGSLAESVAYELAQSPQELQWRVASSKVKPGSLQADKLRRVREAWENGARWNMEFVCTATGKVCGHGDVAFRRDLSCPSWEELCKGEKCCLTCSRGGKCGYGSYCGACGKMCKEAAAKRQAVKAAADAKEAKATEKRKARAFEEFRAKVGPYIRAAEAAGLADDVELRFEYSKCSVGDMKELVERPELEHGRWMFSEPAAKDVAAIADLMGCSVDFLLGRTEVLAMAKADNPSVGSADSSLYTREPVWQTGEPERDGRYYCKIDFNDGLEPWLDDLTRSGGSWKALDKDATVIGWWPLPEG